MRPSVPTRRLSGRRADLRALAERVRDIEARAGVGPEGRAGSIAFPGGFPLALGTTHEWLGAHPDDPPPLALLADLSRRGVGAHAGAARAVWIGRRVWPYPCALRDDLLRRCVFVDPPDGASRVWAIDLALRSEACAVVVADGAGLDMAASRRLQLAARDGGALGLVARRCDERSTRSAATTRWLVAPAPSPGARARWTVELLRCKGVQPEGPRRWTVEAGNAEGIVALPADLGDRSGQTAPARRIA